MVKFKNFLWGTLAMLTALLMVGCSVNENPVRTSLDVDTSTLELTVGESKARTATSKAGEAVITYTSSNPSVAAVDQKGNVTGIAVGNAVITVSMDETRESWYAGTSVSYKVVVSPVSAPALKNVDKKTPLTLVAAEDGKITVSFNGGITLANDIKYTVNGGDEQTIAKNTEGSYDIVVKKGDMVQLYSLNSSLGGSGGAGARGMTRAVDSGDKFINIKPSMKTVIFGNVMSLLKGKDNLDSEAAETIEAPNAFYGLFSGADKLVNSEERDLVLPAKELKEGCYQEMFSGCKSIEKVPELPAPTLVKDCYSGIFADCSKLSGVKCLALEASLDCLKDWLTGAGTETTPKFEYAEGSDLLTIPDAIPDNFTKVIAITKITVAPKEKEMAIGDTITLKKTVEPIEAQDRPIQWFSDNIGVATVTDKGFVTAVGAGSAVITVSTLDGSIFDVCKVTVKKEEIKYHKVFVYGEYSELEPPFSPRAEDAAAMRFSSTEGKYFRTLTDDEYFGLKTLIVDVSDATDDCTMKVMNGWWSATYSDNVPVTNGQLKIQITEKMANDCAKGGDGRDLNLMLTKGSCTINSVYYMEEGEEKPKVIAESISLTPPDVLYYNPARYDVGSLIFVSFKPENTTTKDVKWTVSDPKVLEIFKEGWARGLSEGVATVTATTIDGSNLTAQCEVKVKLLARIWYENEQVNKTTESKPFINPLSQDNGYGITGVTYSSSDESVAKVNATTGEVTIAEGATEGQSVEITATASVADDVQWFYSDWSTRTASYTLKLVPATTQAEMEDFTPDSW